MPTLKPSNEDVRVYEIAIMYQPDLGDKAETELLKEVEAFCAEAEGVMIFKDPWSKRGLAYPIKGYDEAKFCIYYYEANPAGIRELDKQLRLLKGILRHLIVIPPKDYEAISFEDTYQQWLKTRETAADIRTRKKEEKLKATVTDQAKRKAKRAESKKAPAAAPMKAKDLDQEIDKLISDSDLKI